MARIFRSSAEGGAATCPLSTVTPIPGFNVHSSFPSGPFTETTDPDTFTSTPVGTGIGLFPMRDMAPLPTLPDCVEHFAAQAGLARRLVGHDAFRGRKNGHPDAVAHARNLSRTHVHASPSLAHAVDAWGHLLPGPFVEPLGPQHRMP